MKILTTKRINLKNGDRLGEFTYDTSTCDSADGMLRGFTSSATGFYQLETSKATYITKNRFEYNMTVLAVYSSSNMQPVEQPRALAVLKEALGDAMIAVDQHAFPDEYVCDERGREYHLKGSRGACYARYQMAEALVKGNVIGKDRMTWAQVIQQDYISLEELVQYLHYDNRRFGKDSFGTCGGEPLAFTLARMGAGDLLDKMTCTRAEQQQVFGTVDFGAMSLMEAESVDEICRVITERNGYLTDADEAYLADLFGGMLAVSALADDKNRIITAIATLDRANYGSLEKHDCAAEFTEAQKMFYKQQYFGAEQLTATNLEKAQEMLQTEAELNLLLRHPDILACCQRFLEVREEQPKWNEVNQFVFLKVLPGLIKVHHAELEAISQAFAGAYGYLTRFSMFGVSTAQIEQMLAVISHLQALDLYPRAELLERIGGEPSNFIWFFALEDNEEICDWAKKISVENRHYVYEQYSQWLIERLSRSDLSILFGEAEAASLAQIDLSQPEPFAELDRLRADMNLYAKATTALLQKQLTGVKSYDNVVGRAFPQYAQVVTQISERKAKEVYEPDLIDDSYRTTGNACVQIQGGATRDEVKAALRKDSRLHRFRVKTTLTGCKDGKEIWINNLYKWLFGVPGRYGAMKFSFRKGGSAEIRLPWDVPVRIWAIIVEALVKEYGNRVVVTGNLQKYFKLEGR